MLGPLAGRAEELDMEQMEEQETLRQPLQAKEATEETILVEAAHMEVPVAEGRLLLAALTREELKMAMLAEMGRHLLYQVLP